MKDTKVSAQIVLQAIEKAARPIAAKLQAFKIKTQDEYDAAAQLMKQLKGYAKDADDKRKEITGPLNQALTATNKLFKPFMDSVALIESATKTQMLEYVERQDEKIAVLEQNLESGKAGSLRSHEAKVAKLTPTSTAAQVREKEEVQVTSKGKLPAKYLIPDLAAIKADLLAGKKVPGAKLVTVKSIAI